MTYNHSMKHFEWDENKQEANLTKHGIDFVDAIKIFADPYRIEFNSIRNGEKRYQTLGIVEDLVVLLVVYTDRDEKKRIISARRASKKEREVYYSLR